MPQDLTEFMGLDPKDIANKLIERQKGKLAQTKTQLPTSAPKPEGLDEFMTLNPSEISRKIAKKYDFQEPLKLVNAETLQPATESELLGTNIQRMMLEEGAKAGEYDAAKKAEAKKYPGQITWDEKGNIVPYTGPKVEPGPARPGFTQANERQQIELAIPEGEEEKKYWAGRVKDYMSKEGIEPPALYKAFDIAYQPLGAIVNMQLLGAPALVNKVFFHEDMPAPLTMAGGIGRGLGDLIGLVGPGKAADAVANGILGKAFIPTRAREFMTSAFTKGGSPAALLDKVGEFATGWIPKTVVGEIAKRVASSTISMAGIYAIGENNGDTAGEIMTNKLKAMGPGAVAGLIFGGASLARFSKMHPYTGWAMRAGAVNVGLDLLHGTSPWDDRQLWEKIYSYGLNAIFTKDAKNPKDYKTAIEMGKRIEGVRREADEIDAQMKADGMDPVARESLENALGTLLPQGEQMFRKGQTPAPEGDAIAQAMQKATGEQKAASVARKQKFVKGVEKAREVMRTPEEPPTSPISEGDVLPIQETLLKISDALAEPGKLSAAKRAELQATLWDINDALEVERAEKARMATGGAPVAETRAKLEAMRGPLEQGVAAKGAAPEDVWPSQIANRRTNTADRALFDRVLSGKGSAADKARVRDVMTRRAQGTATPEELTSIIDQLEIDPVMGLGVRKKFMLDQGFDGTGFWAMDFAKMGALNERITPENVNYYLNKAGTIIRKSLPAGLKAIRWGGDEIMFYREPGSTLKDSEVKHYLNKLKFSLEKSTPFGSRWVKGNSAGEAVNLIEDAKKAEGGHKQLPADFDAARWMKFKKTAGDPEAVALGFDNAEAPAPAAPRKRTKMNVKAKDDGTLDITTEQEDIPEGPVQTTGESWKGVESRRFAEEEVRTQEPFEPTERGTWNVGNIMDELGAIYPDKGRSEIKDMARKAYVRGKRSGQWTWLDRKYGKKPTEGGGAPPAAAPPRSAPPRTPPAPAPAMARGEIASPRASQSEIPLGKIERVREAEGKVETWKQSVRDANDVIQRARKTGDKDTVREYADRARAAKQQLDISERELIKARVEAKKETKGGTEIPEGPVRAPEKLPDKVADKTSLPRETKKGGLPPERVAKPEREAPAKPAKVKPIVKPEEIIKANGEDYWGPLVEGGVPQQFENLQVGEIWEKPGKGQNRAKIIHVDSDQPWNADVLYKGEQQATATDVYDLWADGFRPVKWKGGKSFGRVEAPRPTRFLTAPEDTGEKITPESAPKRSSREVLDKQARLEAARENARRRRELGLEEAEPEGVKPDEVDFNDIPEAKGRTFEELYDKVLADPRYEADAENLFDYAQDTIDKSLRYGKEDMAPQFIDDMRMRAVEHFIRHFDPAKSDSPTLKEAVERYVRRWARFESKRMGREFREFEQLRAGTEEGEESPFGELTEESNAFYNERFPKNRYLSEAPRTDAQIMLEEGRLTERQKLAQDALGSVRQSLPIEDIPVFNKYMNETVFGETMPVRKMAEELGISKSTIQRKIDGIRSAITKKFMEDPVLYNEFVDGARKEKEFFDRAKDARIEQRMTAKEEAQAQHGPIEWAASEIPESLLKDIQRRLTNAEKPEEMFGANFDRFKYAMGTKIDSRPNVIQEPEFFQVDAEVRRIFGRDVGLGDNGEHWKSALFKAHEKGFISGEMIRDIIELPGKAITRIGDVAKNSWRSGKVRAIRDAVRQNYWSETFHNYTNKLLEVEGEASKITERAFRASRAFWKSPKEIRDDVWMAKEFEDETGTRIGARGSKAWKKLKDSGITWTDAHKTAYHSITDALEGIVLREMPKLMRRAGFSTEEINDLVKRSFRSGFLPHRRYGDYVLSWIGPAETEKGRRYKRNVETFKYESERDARKAELAKSYTMSSGQRRRINFEEFRFSEMSIDPGSFAMLLEHWPVASRIFNKVAVTEGEKRAIDMVRKLAKEGLMANFAKGAFAQRRGRLGWSKDYDRAVQDYFMHVPFSLAKRYMRGEIENEITKLKSGQDQKHARSQYDFWSGATHKEGPATMGMRRIIYDYYLMLKPAFFMQNMTQWATTHTPLAIAEAAILKKAGGDPDAAGVKSSLRAGKRIMELMVNGVGRIGSDKELSLEATIKDDPNFTTTEKKVLQDLFDAEEIGAIRTKENVGRSFADIRLSTRGAGRFLPSPEIFGILSEKANRLHSALTALDLYKNEGYGPKELYQKTVDFIRRADFPYSKATRMKIAQGPIKSMMFVFKSYLTNYMGGLMPYLYKNDKKSAVAAAGVFAALAGAMGVPGYQLIRAGVKQFLPGKDDIEKEQNMIDLEDVIDEKFAGVLMHGIPALMGVDGSSWFGFPDLASAVPVTFATNWKNSLVAAFLDDSVDREEIITRIMPSYIKHWMRLHRMNETGAISVDRYGAPTVTPQDVKRMSAEIRDWAWDQYKKLPTPEQMSDLENAMYSAIGAPSLTQSRYYKRVQGIKNLSEKVKTEKGEMNRVVARMFIENVPSKEWADYIDGMDNSTFGSEFWNIVHSWPEDKQQELRDYIKEQADRGMNFNTQAILSAIWERMKTMKNRFEE